MLKIKEIVRPQSLEEAYELNQKRTNRILGGMLWMRMSNIQIQKAIDLSGLGLDKIEETEEEFSIGCMVTLRELELHTGLNTCFEGLIRRSVEDIVGVQFRNSATIGGSLFGRFGFSDVLTAFLVLDTYVELYRGGVCPLAEFASGKRDNDILVRVIVKKTKGHYAYQSYRNTKTDFPVLAVAMAQAENGVKAAVGARPQRAEVRIVTDMEKNTLKALADSFAYGSNMRASAEYRKHLASVLLKRAAEEIQGKELV
ncbi:FAD binding domain-containing protein [Jingyaoa shaoxingensis]|uniref:FAD binding domain-containing protein n=1 Tax=Jingyaoa shaoxingensis TaxID=2763671 RepID=A0ABR7NCL4_9FIRM|nr:FAD binding domain-containing protein [Jingyaoa shaoxingensis]MBC8574141.1 FAD binding domain-containing protein [Jingyaoa shaoxingensis]